MILVEAKAAMPADIRQLKSRLRRPQHIVGFARRGGSPFAFDVRLVPMNPHARLPALGSEASQYPDILPGASLPRPRLSDHAGLPEDDLQSLWKMRQRRLDGASDGKWRLWSVTRRGGRSEDG